MVPPGRFLIVEYDTGAAGPWVPYPLPKAKLSALLLKLSGPMPPCAGPGETEPLRLMLTFAEMSPVPVSDANVIP